SLIRFWTGLISSMGVTSWHRQETGAPSYYRARRHTSGRHAFLATVQLLNWPDIHPPTPGQGDSHSRRGAARCAESPTPCRQLLQICAYAGTLASVYMLNP